MSPKSILFSPIGTADPITLLGDGPMLHIVRHYKPDEVVLFLSPKMAGYEDGDHRYTQAIELLCDSTGQARPDVRVIRSPRADVHRFDAYIADFEEELRQIRKTDKRARVLCNVSSGTPAMEQALVALGAFGEYGLTLLQVATPRRDTNQSDDRENADTFELEPIWELNPDNDGSAVPSRIEEVVLPNFKDRLLRENVLALIDAYDYEAALMVAKQSHSLPAAAVNLIEGARNRLNLSKAASNERARLHEYLWVLEVRKKQGHWADFVRSLTPAYTWTAEFLLERYGLPRSAYTRLVSRKNSMGDGQVLDEEKVRSDSKLWSILRDAFHAGSRSPYLANWMLSDLVAAYCPDATSAKLKMVRDFEEASRNELAHQLSSSSKEDIERRGGSTFEAVMDTLFELNGVSGGKYDELNRQIHSLM